MAATTSQRDLVRRLDPEVYAARVGDVDTTWDEAAAELLVSGFNPAQRDLAVARLVCHRLYSSTDPDARAFVGPTTKNRERSADAGSLPPGYPPDWYTTIHGAALIGLCRQSPNFGLLTGH